MVFNSLPLLNFSRSLIEIINSAMVEKAYKRRALVAKVKCLPYSKGDVLPHEQTHKGPKEDRLKLFNQCQVQFLLLIRYNEIYLHHSLQKKDH